MTKPTKTRKKDWSKSISFEDFMQQLYDVETTIAKEAAKQRKEEKKKHEKSLRKNM